MSDMDRYRATRAIRALEQDAGSAHRTPIVALTTHATQADRERCLAVGMDSWVSKCFAQVVPRRRLQRWLGDVLGRGGEGVREATAPVTQRPLI